MGCRLTLRSRAASTGLLDRNQRVVDAVQHEKRWRVLETSAIDEAQPEGLGDFGPA